MKSYNCIYQCDMNGNILAEYATIQEAARITGISKNTIYYQVKYGKGTKNNKYQYTWKASKNTIDNDTENN